jgi:7,8-dihydropterin-6-yl-methyl-4-(beta-D-ribofuranosyl)aminobenzene 5'-phosphate synthase
MISIDIPGWGNMEIENVGASHCTGLRAAFRFHQEFGDRFFYGCVGSVLEV